MKLPLLDGNPKTDLLFPEIALNSGLGKVLGSVFILGLIAAAYSSADSALTSLTTSFCVDILDLKDHSESEKKHIRKKTHIGMSILLILVIIAFKYLLNSNVIQSIVSISPFNFRVLKHSFKDQNNFFEVSYDDYTIVEDQILPTKIRFSNNGLENLYIEIKSISSLEKINIPFRIPKNYKRIKL